MRNESKEERSTLIDLLREKRDRIKVLEKKETVKESQNRLVWVTRNEKKVKELELTIAQNNMRECSHIFVTTKIDKFGSGHRANTIKYCGCIKCGLEEERKLCYKLFASPMQQETEIIYKGTITKGIFISEHCSLELGMALYKKTLEAHPNISDEMAIKYFNAIIANIRKGCLTKDIKEARIKQLGLSPGFKNWYTTSIIVKH